MKRLLRRLARAIAADPSPRETKAQDARIAPPIEAPTPTDIAMMDEAMACARAARDAGEVPVGAIVFRTDTAEILARAANEREASHDPSGHAEMIAIRAACARLSDWRLNDCTLVVTLEPCVMCAGAIVNARVGRVVYGARDPKAGACESLYEILRDPRLNHRPIVVPGVREDECAELLRAFFRALRESHRRTR